MGEAVQALEKLGEKSKLDDVCKGLKKHSADWFKEPSALLLYHFAETTRVLKCSGVSSLSSKIDEFLSNVDLSALSNANELYFTYLLN